MSVTNPPVPEVEDVRYIRDVDTLRALSDTTRMRILETMVQRETPAWSVKELAAALGIPQTRLYHHVELLLEHDLVRAAERRIVSGIIETRYVAAARSFQLDRALFAGDSPESREALHDTLVAAFDGARAEVELAIRLGTADADPGSDDSRRILVSRGIAALSPTRAAELRQRLQALTEEFDDAGDPEARPFGIVLALYPMPPAGEPATDAEERTDD